LVNELKINTIPCSEVIWIGDECYSNRSIDNKDIDIDKDKDVNIDIDKDVNIDIDKDSKYNVNVTPYYELIKQRLGIYLFIYLCIYLFINLFMY
jgi:hypothetical protein